VVAPDRIGRGKSPKPDIHYSFHLLAAKHRSLAGHLEQRPFGAGFTAVNATSVYR
jgi:hypothetical protein